MHVSVTAGHIKRGIRGECEKCPVALAMLDAGATSVMVGDFYIYWKIARKGTCRVRNPKTVQAFIERFDSGKPVKPFEFDLVSEEQP